MNNKEWLEPFLAALHHYFAESFFTTADVKKARRLNSAIYETFPRGRLLGVIFRNCQGHLFGSYFVERGPKVNGDFRDTVTWKIRKHIALPPLPSPLPSSKEKVISEGSSGPEPFDPASKTDQHLLNYQEFLTRCQEMQNFESEWLIRRVLV